MRLWSVLSLYECGLIGGCIEPLPPDVNGTCGRDSACVCGDCWIRLGRLNRGPLGATAAR